MDNPNQSFVERYMTPIAVVVGAIIIAFALAYGHGAIQGNTGAAPSGQQAATSADIKKVKTNGEPYVGSADAPVLIISAQYANNLIRGL
jgi:hypothetical protein